MSTNPFAHHLTRRAFATGLITALPSLAKADRAIVEPGLRLSDDSVALTLDACSGGFDARLAQSLVEIGVPTTIFATGLWLRQNPTGLAYLLSHPAIFTLQNHGAWHRAPVLGGGTIFGQSCARTLDDVRQEVTDGSAALIAATGSAPRWYRGATARYSPEAVAAIEGWGFAVAGYSLNADMGASLPGTRVAERIGRAKAGDVIIGHINQPTRSSGIGVAIGSAALHRAGMRFSRLS